MEKKADTPQRVARRRYEENNREKRKAANGTFSTYMPRQELDEINQFLKTYNITKVDLIREGYRVFQKHVKGKPEN